MRLLLISILISVNIFAAVISGNQDKVSIINGSANISSAGKTTIINSGQISFTSSSGASAARNIKKGDLKDIYSSLRAEGGDEEDNPNEIYVNLKFPASTLTYAKKIKSDLVSKKVPRRIIKITKEKGKKVLIVKKINLTLLKSIYPAYHSAAKKYFAKKRNKGKVPTLKMNNSYVRRIHG
jgi:hypothetical protein